MLKQRFRHLINYDLILLRQVNGLFSKENFLPQKSGLFYVSIPTQKGCTVTFVSFLDTTINAIITDC